MADPKLRWFHSTERKSVYVEGRDHQIGRPEPSSQRQLGVVHDGAGGHRGLLAAAGALVGPRLGLQFPGLGLAAARADKAARPARRVQVCGAGGTVNLSGQVSRMHAARQTSSSVISSLVRS